MREQLQQEIADIEIQYRMLRSYQADDEEAREQLLQLKKDCLQRLISKQDQLLALRMR